ncbi:MAG: glycogen synthase, partial [Desulfobacterales bacterium]
YDSQGLSWAIDQAIAFHARPDQERADQIRRIMQESMATFNHDVTARHYIRLYEKMLQRPLIVPNVTAS